MKKFVLVLVFVSLGCSNSKDEDENTITCLATIINHEKYTNSESDLYDIINIEIENTCLRITIRYGGGCGKVSAILVDSGDIIESNPPQRKLRLLLTDNDNCEALITKNFYFDIENLKVENTNSILLNFQNTDLTFLYEY